MLNHHISYLDHIDKWFIFLWIQLHVWCHLKKNSQNLLDLDILNQPIKCIINPLGSCPCNWFNRNMQWISWWFLLILIIPPFLKIIWPWIVTCKTKNQNIECSNNIILTWKIQLICIGFNQGCQFRFSRCFVFSIGTECFDFGAFRRAVSELYRSSIYIIQIQDKLCITKYKHNVKQHNFKI